jgi:hypothetical protein
MKAIAANLHISVGTVHSIIQNIGCTHGLCGLCFGIFLFNTVVVYWLTSVELYWHAAQEIGARPQQSTEQCHFIGLDRQVAWEGVIQLEYTEVR